MRRHEGESPVAGPMRSWRVSQGLTQEKASRLLRTSRTNWARWETGAVWPDPGWRRRILRLVEAAPVGITPAQVREFRERHGYLQRELACLLGVTQSSISRWEHGNRGPGRHEGTLWRLIDRLDARARFRFPSPESDR